MTQQEALQVLVNVALHAQEKGILTLKDAVNVKNAIDVFTPEQPSQEVKDITDLLKNKTPKK